MVRGRGYVPERGDLVWVDFDPQAGHEQAKRRPALVLSRSAYNVRAGLFLICPVSSKIKGYPFEVALSAGGTISGVVLADQVKSFDWSARSVAFIEKVPASVLDQVSIFAAGIVVGK